MPTAQQTREATSRVVDAAVEESARLAGVMLTGVSDWGRRLAFSTLPSVVEYYGTATATLAADAYNTDRAAANLSDLFEAEPVLTFDEEALFTAIAWGTQPLYDRPRNVDVVRTALQNRFRDVISDAVMAPARDTTMQAMHADKSAMGWRRITRAGACKFCLMLAGRGAVYRKGTVDFAAHNNCHCTAEVVFDGGEWTDATEAQYIMAKPARNRSAADRAWVRDYLARTAD